MKHPASSLRFLTAVLVIVVAGAVWLTVFRTGARAYMPLNDYRPKDFGVVRDGATWHLYAIYECDDAALRCNMDNEGLMHLTSNNLNTWTEVGWVIPPGESGSFDDHDVWAPTIVKHDGTWYMYYAAVRLNASNQREQTIGLATSTDLTTWTKHASAPVFRCDTLGWTHWDPTTAEGVDCRDPFVMRDEANNRWLMFYVARMSGSAEGLTRPMVVGHAVSTDLLNWTDLGPVPTTAGYVTESVHVFQHDSLWYMVWTNNCTWRSEKCLKVATAQDAGGPYVGYDDFPPALQYEYGSEFYRSGGREYFFRISNSNQSFAFNELDWSSGTPQYKTLQYSSIGDSVWLDADGDAGLDLDEDGINGVRVRLYLDNGDDAYGTDDWLYDEKTTAYFRNSSVDQNGYYFFSRILPGTYWVVFEPTFDPGSGPLAGLRPTTPAGPFKVTVADRAVDLRKDVGFTVPDAAPPAAVTNLRAL